MNWFVWECNKQTSHSIHSGNWANTCAFRFGCWFRTCLASTCENGVVQRPKAYREFSNDQWYQNYCGYNQKQHPSGSVWSFRHSSTYFNCGLLFHLFHHTCAHPFHTQRATGADGLPFARGPGVAHLAAGEVSGLWRLLRTRGTRVQRVAMENQRDYEGKKLGKIIIVIILIIVIVVIIMIVIIMIIVIMLIIVTMM